MSYPQTQLRTLTSRQQKQLRLTLLLTHDSLNSSLCNEYERFCLSIGPPRRLHRQRARTTTLDRGREAERESSANIATPRSEISLLVGEGSKQPTNTQKTQLMIFPSSQTLHNAKVSKMRTQGGSQVVRFNRRELAARGYAR
jgi:hypothetical protein